MKNSPKYSDKEVQVIDENPFSCEQFINCKGLTLRFVDGSTHIIGQKGKPSKRANKVLHGIIKEEKETWEVAGTWGELSYINQNIKKGHVLYNKTLDQRHIMGEPIKYQWVKDVLGYFVQGQKEVRAVLKHFFTNEEIGKMTNELNKYNLFLKNNGDRRLNFSEVIGESLVCHHNINLRRLHSVKNGGHKCGDFIDISSHEISEGKCSTGSGPTSFSPKHNYKNLYFVYFPYGTQYGEYNIYEINYKTLEKIPTSKGLTFGDEQKENELIMEKRKSKIKTKSRCTRIRVNLVHEYIEKFGTKPLYATSYLHGKITYANKIINSLTNDKMCNYQSIQTENKLSSIEV
jgi:hypothetical protein